MNPSANPNQQPSAPLPESKNRLGSTPEARHEQLAAGAGEQAPSPGAPPPAAAPAPALPATDATSGSSQPTPNPSTTSSYDGPMIAGDVDVIEKEWVDRADKIIKQTANDPYQEEEQVEELQVEYMKKRYGKDIKKSE